MKKSTATLILILFSLFTFSQDMDWSWGYNYDAFNSDTRGLTATAPNGDVYLIGNFWGQSVAIGSTILTNSGATNTGEIYIVKYNSSGTVLWVKKEGGLGMDSIASIATDSVGNFYLLGNYVNQITLDTITLVTPNYVTAFVAKYDGNGTALWAKNIGSVNENTQSMRVKTDNLGNVYVTGLYSTASLTFDTVVLTANNYDALNNYGNVFVAKFNPNGIIQWAKTTQRTGTTVFSNMITDISFDSQHNVLIGGTFFSATMGFDALTLNNSSGSNTIFMAKFDGDNGNIIWANTPTVTNPNNLLWSVTTDTSDNVYFSGTFAGTMVFDTISLTSSNSGNSLFVAKFDSDGNPIWARTALSNAYSAIDSSDTDAQGNLYVTGSFGESSIDFGNGIIASSSTVGALFVLKYNSSGTPLWIKTADNFNVNARLSIDCFNENEIYIAGHFFGTSGTILNLGSVSLAQTPSSNDDIFIAKLTNTSLGEISFDHDNIALLPNPVENILYSNPLTGLVQYKVSDVTGKELISGEVNSQALQLSFDEFQSGIYLVEMQNEEGKTIVKKIIKK